MRSATQVMRFLGRTVGLAALLLPPLLVIDTTTAHAAGLTAEPITWNVIGLDSNNVSIGPSVFPVGARVCNTSGALATNVQATFVWDSANAFINNRAGSATTINVASLAAGACSDYYFEVEIARNAAAYDTTRSYHIAVTADGGLSGSTPTPRELYVERLISQGRNEATDLLFSTDGVTFTSVNDGGSMSLLLGETYFIRLVVATATGGYEQLESFLNMPNTVFQTLGVVTTYTADTSPYVSNPNDKLYGDGCNFETNPFSLNYRSCNDVGKVGGDITITYQIKILSVPAPPLGNPEPLSMLIYDKSGSSYHYNNDYGTGTREIFVLDPATIPFTKSFVSDTIAPAGTSALYIRVTNPSPSTLTGVNWSDTLPAGVTIAASPNASATMCGATPTLSAPALGNTISIFGADIPANSTCVVQVNVTAAVIGSYVNTTGNLFLNGTGLGTGIDTGKVATATLNVDGGALVCVPGQLMAMWGVPLTSTNPPDAAGGVPLAANRAANVATATAVAATPANTQIAGPGSPISGFPATNAWKVFGWNAAQSLTFNVQTKNYTNVTMTWDWTSPGGGGPTGAGAVTSRDGVLVLGATAVTPPARNAGGLITTVNLATSATTTQVTLGGFTGAQNNNQNSDLWFDNIRFIGCAFVPPPTIVKAFQTDPILVNGISRLTFTMANPAVTNPYDAIPLTGVQFTDVLPAGLVIAAVPNVATTCGGTPVVTAPAAGSTITVTGAALAVGGSCTVAVDVRGTAAGTFQNVSGRISSTQSGINTGATGFATDTITVLAPPAITKAFGTASMLAGSTTSLSFTVSNPNGALTLTGVAFSDPLPGGLQVAAVPNIVGSCPSGTISAVAGSTTISLAGASLAPQTSCTFSVDVTGTTAGAITNVTSAVTSNEATPGNAATANIVITAQAPGIALLKQVAPTATGVWRSFMATSVGAQVFYQLTIENTGNVPLSPVSVTDPNVSTAGCAWPATLPVASPLNNDHVATCVIGPVTAVSGFHPNTATASGTGGGLTATDTSTASYSTTGLTLVKVALQSTFSAAGNIINYTYGVTNTGAASLAGPVTVADNKVAVTCPAVSTVGNGDGNLDPGETISCTAAYTVVAGDVTAGAVTNVATATAAGVSSNSATETVPRAGSVDLAVTKTDGTAIVSSGGSTIYTIEVRNNGPSSSASTLADPAVPGLTKTAIGVCSASGGANCPIAGPGAAQLNINSLENGTVVIPAMPSGGSITFPITATVTSTDADVDIVNVVTVTASGGTIDNDPSNNSASDVNRVGLNFGHLPSSYNGLNLRAQGGGFHLTGSTRLGATAPFEADGVNNAQFDLEADDNGIAFPTGATWTVGATGGSLNVTVTCPSNPCVLNGWMDWGNDGSMAEAGDQIFTSQSVNNGTTLLTFAIPAGTPMTGFYYARFRVYPVAPATNSPAGQAATGGVPTVGEVEDYLFGITGGIVTRAVVSSFVARDTRGGVTLEWRTSAEIGTVGFHLRRFDDREQRYVAVNQGLLPSLISTQRGGVYRYVDEGARTGTDYVYELVEVEATGRTHTYGPYRVNTAATLYTPEPAVAGKGLMLAGMIPGYTRAPHAAVAVGNARDRQQPAPRSRTFNSAVADAAKVGVPETGVYYVSFQDLVDRGGLGTASPSTLALTSRGRALSLAITDDQTGVLFYGEKATSAFERESVYRLASSGVAARMRKLRHPLVSAPTGNETFVKTLHLEQDVFDAPNIFTNTAADFWMWDFVFAGQESKSFAFRADGAARTGGASVTVHLKGATDTVSARDHHAMINLNGTAIGEASWNGLEAADVALSFDSALLVDGENTIEVVGMTDTDAEYSIFYVDSFDVRYASRYRASGNRAQVVAGGNPSILISGFTTPDVMVFDVTYPRSPKAILVQATQTADGSYGVALSPPTSTTVYAAVTPAAVHVAPRIVPDFASTLKNGANQGQYVVITTSALQGTAQTLATHRSDLSSQVIDVEDVYDEFSFGIQDPRAIKQFLTYARSNWSVAPRYVVLAGDGTYDYRDHMGLGGNLIPPMLVSTPEGLFPSDIAYGNVTGGLAPEIIVGRLPVSTPTELEQVILKIQARESASGSEWLNRLTLVSDNADAGGDFPAASNSVAARATGMQIQTIDLTTDPIEAARASFFGSINAGSGLVSYIGHGGFDLLANEGLFQNADVALLTNAELPAVVTAMTCLAGNPGLPGYPSVADVLMRHADGGAAAVWAPTGLSKHELAVPLAEGFYSAASGGGRIGDAIRSSMFTYQASGKPGYMISMYTLLGDPAMQLR